MKKTPVNVVEVQAAVPKVAKAAPKADAKMAAMEDRLKELEARMALMQVELSTSAVAVPGKKEIRHTVLGTVQALCKHTGLKLQAIEQVEERITPGTGIEKSTLI